MRALDPNATEFVFFTVDDDEDDKDRSLNKTMRGKLGDLWPTLVDLNDRGAGIFVTINEVRGKVRKSKNVTRVRAVFADLDGAPVEPVLAHDPPPHIVVESSPGKWHAYWLVDDLPVDQFRDAQEKLIHRFDGDDAVKDLPRVMRLPGFYHRKRGSDRPEQPHLVRIARIDDRPPTAASDFGAVTLESAVDNPFTEHAKTTRPPAEIDDIKSALNAVSADDYNTWLRVGAAIHNELGDDGFALWDEWSQKSDKYGEREVRKKWGECAKLTDITIGTLFYQASEARAARVAENSRIGDDITPSEIRPTVLTLDQMLERLVYVSAGAVGDLKTGRYCKKDHAADEYAASRHNDKPALPQWMASRNRTTVSVVAWVPGEGHICRPPESGGTAFNTWRGLRPMDAPDDWQDRAQPFVDHVAYLVPVEAERKRFLQWLAHTVQRPEVLPHTAYLMTTPTTGIGRNWLASVMVRVLRGHVAAGVSISEMLDGGYTGRLSQKLMAIVDEAKEGSGERRWQRAERLKSLITEEHRHINHKYGLQVVEKNCCRWLMFSNHLDAIPFDNSDRRIIVVENPTERKPPNYFDGIYPMLHNLEFIASVRQWLERHDTTGFRAGEHAPTNAAKERALDTMMSEVDVAVREFKEECETDLASMSVLRSSSGLDNANDAHVRHAIARVGMVNTGRRVRRGQERHAVVIVRPDRWTVEQVKAASATALLIAMGFGE